MTQTYDICIIDDDDEGRHLIGTRLERWGFAWIGADGGKAGLDLITQHHPKVILCDWTMPGFDGPAVLKQVRADPGVAATFFIMVTAHDTPTRKYEALEAGADDYLAKPIDFRELAARLREERRPAHGDVCAWVFACGKCTTACSMRRSPTG